MKKGFTLIELLVVIAIIGILASIVLVSFPGATKKAMDSRIVSAIAQARTVMTYIKANDGDFDNLPGACTAGNPYLDDMKPLCDEVTAQGQTLNLVKNTASDDGCVYSKLNAKDNYWYCADSTGRAGFVSSAAKDPGGTNYCDGTTAVCPAFD